jgi:hypothetical protein
VICYLVYCFNSVGPCEKTDNVYRKLSLGSEGKCLMGFCFNPIDINRTCQCAMGGISSCYELLSMPFTRSELIVTLLIF